VCSDVVARVGVAVGTSKKTVVMQEGLPAAEYVENLIL
jgi:hypothetical protein